MTMVTDVIKIFFTVLEYAIFFRCILSWFPIDRSNPIYQFLHSLTEPILAPVRNIVYKSPIGGSMTMIDFSPVIAMLILNGIESVILNLLS